MVDWTAVSGPEEWYRAVSGIVTELQERARNIPPGITIHLGSLQASHGVSSGHEPTSHLVDRLRDARAASPPDVPDEVTAALGDLIEYLDELERETGPVVTTHLQSELELLTDAVRQVIQEHSPRSPSAH